MIKTLLLSFPRILGLRIFCLILISYFLFNPASASAGSPKTLAEQLAIDNPRMISYLQSLTPERKNKTVPGIKLSDGSEELKGYVFLGSRHLAAKKQHVFLFKGEGAYRAYAWVEKGGQSLVIPEDKSGSPGESAGLLSGDIFTFTEVDFQDGLVVLFGATPAWLKGL